MNKLIDLEAGMVVEMDTPRNTTRYCILIPTFKGLSLINKEWCRFGDLKENQHKILKVYLNYSSNFYALFDTGNLESLELIWEKEQ